MDDKVIISKLSLIYLKVYAKSLQFFQNVIDLCPNCETMILCKGYIYPDCE